MAELQSELADDFFAHHHEGIKEEEFSHKLMDYKKKQTGHEFRLFGHTMASYD